MRTLMIMSIIGLSACGISDSTLLADVDADDAQKICEEFDARTVTCGEAGFEVEITLGGDCESTSENDVPDGCTATVGDYRSCYGAFADLTDEEVCGNEGFPSECDPLFAASCTVSE